MNFSAAPNITEALEAKSGDLVTIVGGGGKTTLMYALAKEMRARGLRAAAATTTRILPPAKEQGELVCATSPDELTTVDYSPASPLKVLCAGINADGKVRGLPPEWCDALIRGNCLDFLVVEGDGSRRLPLKAPGPKEPVVPETTTLFVAVVGLSALGKKISEIAFRPELVARLAGVSADAPVTPEIVSAVLCHPDGLKKGCPQNARAVVVLNQTDMAEIEDSRKTARLTLASAAQWRRVVLSSLAIPNSLPEFAYPHADL